MRARGDGAHGDEAVVHAVECAQLDVRPSLAQHVREARAVAGQGVALRGHHHGGRQLAERRRQQRRSISVRLLASVTQVLLPEPLHRTGGKAAGKLRVAAAGHGVVVAGVAWKASGGDRASSRVLRATAEISAIAVYLSNYK